MEDQFLLLWCQSYLVFVVLLFFQFYLCRYSQLYREFAPSLCYVHKDDEM